MQLRRATSGDLRSLAAHGAPLQARPDRHIVYLGVEQDGIEAELDEITWQTSSALAYVDDELVGWLLGDVDDEMGRVWWIGPFVSSDDWVGIADVLLAECRSQLADDVTEEEMAVDAEFELAQSWAAGHGFEIEEGSWVLTLERDLDPPHNSCRPVTDDDGDAVIALHETNFPGTHLTGRALMDDRDESHVRLVVEANGAIAGYVAVEKQPDGGGYIDYLGVATEHRRQGLGGDLVKAGVEVLTALGAAPIHLTVREGSAGARELYQSLGFTEERLVRPMRRGFSLA